jgi:SpoVK/Ycf46/Vps4 family AAA+-type ATPase
MQMLDGFIGMESIRNKVLEIVSQIEMAMKDENLGAPCIHMKFVGNPGTGKTTVARVIGKILKERGVLRNGGFFEYRGRDFVGRYIGETAPKTTAMCRDAYGSVLFIDEAYSLYRGSKTSSNDFGKEAIDTLIAEMENHRKDLVVIMAGYPEEMEELMEANAGLESRIPYTIEFPNYTREQLFEIFILMVKKSFKYKEGFEECARDYFLSLPESVFDSKEFSNARFVRNLFERTWGKATLRWQLYKEEAMELSKEDFIAATNESDFAKNMQKNRRMMGFMA